MLPNMGIHLFDSFSYQTYNCRELSYRIHRSNMNLEISFVSLAYSSRRDAQADLFQEERPEFIILLHQEHIVSPESLEFCGSRTRELVEPFEYP
jgi:hypothetical protein